MSGYNLDAGLVSRSWVRYPRSLHSSVTRACAGDIEVNPGPPKLNPEQAAAGKRETRRTTLTRYGEGEPRMADLMKEMKSIREDIKKRFDDLTI